MLMVFMKDNFPASFSFLGITLPVCNTVLCITKVEREVITKMRNRKHLGERKYMWKKGNIHEKGKEKRKEGINRGSQIQQFILIFIQVT